MPPSTTSLFPDINVWVALTYEGHVHHSTAATWFTQLPPHVTLAFCRFTQLGLLRLLTTAVVMGDEVMTQPQAWAASRSVVAGSSGHVRRRVSRDRTALSLSHPSAPAGD